VSISLSNGTSLTVADANAAWNLEEAPALLVDVPARIDGLTVIAEETEFALEGDGPWTFQVSMTLIADEPSRRTACLHWSNAAQIVEGGEVRAEDAVEVDLKAI